jgi:hypothetical protein
VANKTLLNAVNQILIRVGDVKSDSLLTTLTNAAIQPSIDIAVQVVNEGIDHLYSLPGLEKPTGVGSSTVTLAASTNAYSLAGDLVRLRWPLQDRTNGTFIYPYPGGYTEMLNDQIIPSAFTGLPLFAAIRPTDGLLYLDAAPTSSEAGLVYSYEYLRDTELSVYTDTVPFGNAVFRAMVPAWAQLWKRDKRQEFDTSIFNLSMGRAAGLAIQVAPRETTRRMPAAAEYD